MVKQIPWFPPPPTVSARQKDYWPSNDHVQKIAKFDTYNKVKMVFIIKVRYFEHIYHRFCNFLYHETGWKFPDISPTCFCKMLWFSPNSPIFPCRAFFFHKIPCFLWFFPVVGTLLMFSGVSVSLPRIPRVWPGERVHSRGSDHSCPRTRGHPSLVSTQWCHRHHERKHAPASLQPAPKTDPQKLNFYNSLYYYRHWI